MNLNSQHCNREQKFRDRDLKVAIACEKKKTLINSKLFFINTGHGRSVWFAKHFEKYTDWSKQEISTMPDK
jgi:hypothetical protein